jgi:hypothetical protein
LRPVFERQGPSSRGDIIEIDGVRGLRGGGAKTVLNLGLLCG